MNYKYDDRSFKGIEKMSFQLHCPARQLQRIMNEFEKQGVVKKTGKGAYKLIEIWISDQFPIGIALERVWKIISAICKPHFAVYFTLIRLP